MQSAAQLDATRSGTGASGPSERGRPFSTELVDLRWQAHYWQGQLARAKELVAAWHAKWKATQQALADALRKIRRLHQQVQ